MSKWCPSEAKVGGGRKKGFSCVLKVEVGDNSPGSLPPGFPHGANVFYVVPVRELLVNHRQVHRGGDENEEYYGDPAVIIGAHGHKR